MMAGTSGSSLTALLLSYVHNLPPPGHFLRSQSYRITSGGNRSKSFYRKHYVTSSPKNGSSKARATTNATCLSCRPTLATRHAQKLIIEQIDTPLRWSPQPQLHKRHMAPSAMFVYCQLKPYPACVHQGEFFLGDEQSRGLQVIIEHPSNITAIRLALTPPIHQDPDTNATLCS